MNATFPKPAHAALTAIQTTAKADTPPTDLAAAGSGRDGPGKPGSALPPAEPTALDREEVSFPPSAMQRKIMEILESQARELNQD